MLYIRIYNSYVLHTYSTDRLSCFSVYRGQHMDNVTMNSNNQPWCVMLNPVRQEGDRHEWFAVELKIVIIGFLALTTCLTNSFMDLVPRKTNTFVHFCDLYT